MARRSLRSAALALLAIPLIAGSARAELHRGVAYAEGSADERHLDLYLPAAERRDGASSPLLIFVDSRFWGDPGARRSVDVDFARPLQESGVAVAVVRHRPAPEHPHPSPAQDVAAAVAWLVREAPQWRLDPERFYLSGHGSGAHLAALVALDASYLAPYGLAPDCIAGVIGLSGVYDFAPEREPSDEEERLYAQVFGGARQRRGAAPIAHVGPGRARFLLLAAQQDVPGYVDGGEAFAQALRRRGGRDAEFYFVLGRDHDSILDLERRDAGTRMHLFHFLGLAPLPQPLADLDAATRYWRNPKFSTEPFWQLGAKIERHRADERFRSAASSIFAGLDHKRKNFEADEFDAIALEDLLEALGSARAGNGPWLTLTNVQGERLYFRIEDLRPYRPVIVIGIDDEKNLFRHIDIHRAQREYSWRDDLPRPPYLARPMGAFLYFLEAPTSPPLPRITADFSLTLDGFQRSEEDPLAALRDLAPDLLRVMTFENACVSCHSFRGVGARSGHLRARDGELQGGFALPLESYPPEVWKRFVFEQEQAAAMIGATPNPVRPEVAPALHELIAAERSAAPAP